MVVGARDYRNGKTFDLLYRDASSALRGTSRNYNLVSDRRRSISHEPEDRKSYLVNASRTLRFNSCRENGFAKCSRPSIGFLPPIVRPE